MTAEDDGSIFKSSVIHRTVLHITTSVICRTVL